MELTLIRHATLWVDVAGVRLLVDPQLDPAGARPPVAGTPAPRANPLVDLPLPPAACLDRVDAVLVTHLHRDHLDETGLRTIPPGMPVLCQPPDAGPLRDAGLQDVRPVAGAVDLGEVHVTRTGGRHGHGAIADALAPVSGYVVRAPGEPALYVAGDTVWCDEVAHALAAERPGVVVVNAGAATFLQGGVVVMDADDVARTARAAPGAVVVAVHMEAVNHCVLTRAGLADAMRDAGLADRVRIPADGERLAL